MTKDELKAELAELEAIHNQAKSNVYRKYALANNPYKIGDFITDHIATIKIERIHLYKGSFEPECVYTGTQYNKDGKVSKKQDHNTIYQSNIEKPNITNPVS